MPKEEKHGIQVSKLGIGDFNGRALRFRELHHLATKIEGEALEERHKIERERERESRAKERKKSPNPF